MALPLRVIVGLRLSRKDKISLICLFSVGIIAIVVSMIRVFLIWAKTGSTTPSPAWLALWAIIEGMVGKCNLSERSAYNLNIEHF
jgi:hypothetical protein